tara:strand:+ start:1273 stop:1698 length:426 start_codon:yes stop_codon:yes gene_type:complete
MKGSCNCGNISFEISNQVTGLYQCHCKLCQKQSGSTSNTATIVQASDFTWLSSVDAITRWSKDSGFTAHFCTKCGSPVPNKLRETNAYWIPMGLVDNLDMKIIAHLCCSSKATWDNIGGDAIKYNDMPNNLDNFIKSFQKV